MPTTDSGLTPDAIYSRRYRDRRRGVSGHRKNRQRIRIPRRRLRHP